jgi:hypothetical protein
MPESSNSSRWTRHFLYRTEHTRTTWKFRVGFVALVVVTAWLSREWWMVAIAQSLVCDANGAPSDAILLENFDADYLVFEHATRLRRAGLAPRVLVPIRADSDTSETNAVALGRAEVMAKIAHLGAMDIVPMREVEPISLNAARDVLRFIERERIRSVIVVAPLLRSRRSALIYGATLGRAGITVRCEPAARTQSVNTWTRTWHGVQDVAEQWLKLQYYRLYVLPFRLRAQESADRRVCFRPVRTLTASCCRSIAGWPDSRGPQRGAAV